MRELTGSIKTSPSSNKRNAKNNKGSGIGVLGLRTFLPSLFDFLLGIKILFFLRPNFIDVTKLNCRIVYSNPGSKGARQQG